MRINTDSILNKMGKYRILFVIAISYAVMIALFLVSFFAIYFMSQNTFRTYSDYNASIIIDNVSDKFNEMLFLNNTKINGDILLNSTIEKNVLELKNGVADKENLSNIKKELLLTVMNNKYTDDVFIYLEGSNMIVCTSGFCTTNQYYASYAEGSFDSYEEFMSFLKEKNEVKHFYSYDTEMTFSKTDFTLYNSGKNVGKIVIKNNVGRLFGDYVDENSDIVVIQDGFIIASSNEDFAQKLLSMETIGGEPFELLGRMVYASNVMNNGKRCFYILDMGQVASANRTYIIFVITVCVICILLSIMVCVLFLFYHFIPIKRFGDFIKARSKNKSGDYTYRMFFDAINYIEKSEAGEIEEKTINDKRFREIYLEQWLLYQKEPKGDSIKLLPGQKCALVLIKPQDYEQIFFDQVYEEKSVKLETAEFILTNIFDEEFGNAFYDVVKCKINDMLIWAFTFDETLMWQEKLEDIFTRTERFVKKEFNVSFVNFTSKAYFDMDGVLNDFNEIVKEINRNKAGNILELGNLLASPAKEETTIYYLPPAIKELLCDSVEEGNVKRASEVIDNILKYNIENTNFGINNLKALCAEIYNMINIRLEQFDVDVKGVLEKNRLGKDIIMCDTVDELTKELKHFVGSMCGFFFSKHKDEENTYVKAQKIIKRDYKNPQLSSGTIGDELGLSRDYFLSVFKKETGMKVSDYIHKIRIENACKILTKNKHSITEIAYLVGYTNVRTFTRAFTKIMGVAPGVYRESQN